MGTGQPGGSPGEGSGGGGQLGGAAGGRPAPRHEGDPGCRRPGNRCRSGAGTGHRAGKHALRHPDGRRHRRRDLLFPEKNPQLQGAVRKAAFKAVREGAIWCENGVPVKGALFFSGWRNGMDYEVTKNCAISSWRF